MDARAGRLLMRWPHGRLAPASVGPVILIIAAASIAAGGAVALLAPGIGGPTTASSVGQASPLAATLVLLAGAALVAAGTAAWLARSDRVLAVVAFGAAAAWLAAELAASASVAREARTLGSLLAPLFGPLIVHVAVRVVRGDDPRSRLRWAIVALYLAVAIAALGRALTYDPFFDVHCAPVCDRGDNLLAVRVDVPLAAQLSALGLAASALGGVVLAGWAVRRASRTRPLRQRQDAPVLLASILLGAGLAAASIVRLAMVPDRPSDPLLVAAESSLAGGACLLGAATTALIVMRVRRAEALRTIVDALTAAAGSPSLRATLARTLGDDRLRIAYPVDGGGLIDERGEPIDEPPRRADRATTAIKRGDELIAIVDHVADLDPDLLDREVGAAARLAVDNERLEATVLARLRELRASRARIVAAGDAERSRLERDLHDGAQQRLLALSFELRLLAAALAAAGAAGTTRGAVDDAVARTDLALAELRDLAHGIHPVVLTEDGLVGALASLADTAGVPLVVRGDEIDRCDGQVELAAYLLVVEAVRQAEVQGIERVDVTIERGDGRVRMSIDGPRLEGGDWLRIEDRVGAAGGRSVASAPGVGPATVIVELPCG